MKYISPQIQEPSVNPKYDKINMYENDYKFVKRSLR